MLGSFLLYVPYFFLGNEFDTMTKLVNTSFYEGALYIFIKEHARLSSVVKLLTRYILFSGQRYSSCLLSSTCMGYGANIISKWETMKEGLQFDNVGKQTSDLDLFTFGDVMLMMFVDIILYSLLTW